LVKYNATRAGYNNNWGDCIAPQLFEWLSGEKPKVLPSLHGDPGAKDRVLLMVGSVMKMADSKSGVWGIGYINNKYTFKERGFDVHAVRGPLTRDRLLSQGVKCAEVYGDPALLFPKFYRPAVPKRFDLGVIPHYIDKGRPWVQTCRAEPGVLVINPQQGIFSFVQQVLMCARIASSSLHGLICADAYGIPSRWLRLSDGVVGAGFKFRDYYGSIRAKVQHPMDVPDVIPIREAISACEKHPVDPVIIDKLLAGCPIRKEVSDEDCIDQPTAAIPVGAPHTGTTRSSLPECGPEEGTPERGSVGC